MFSRLYTMLVSKLLFPLHEKIKKHDTVAIKNQLEKSQWQTTEQILAAQKRRLQSFIQTAYQNVPFYKAQFDRLGIKPEEITSPADLAKLPFLDKAHSPSPQVGSSF